MKIKRKIVREKKGKAIFFRVVLFMSGLKLREPVLVPVKNR